MIHQMSLSVAKSPAISTALPCQGGTLPGHGACVSVLAPSGPWVSLVKAEACALPPLVTPHMCMSCGPLRC